MSRGLTAEGVDALDKALARHVDRGDLPGLVAMAARGDDVHVAAIGHKAFGDAEPIGRDAIFRIASVSKPITGLTGILLTQRMMASPVPTELARDFWTEAYVAVDA
jgi:CubicO group peptidase (beta-lactamase class C family)